MLKNVTKKNERWFEKTNELVEWRRKKNEAKKKYNIHECIKIVLKNTEKSQIEQKLELAWVVCLTNDLRESKTEKFVKK